MRKNIQSVLLTMMLLVAASGGAMSQSRDEMLREEFHKTYPLAADGRVTLDNINGSVKITAWDRNEVKVDAVKAAYRQERLNEAQIIVEADASSINIKTEYPNENQTFSDSSPRRYDNPATVEYTLTIPRHARIDTVELINGGLDIDGVEGDVVASSINGAMRAVGLGGEAKLSTINGALEATFKQLNASKGISLNSVNGRVTLVIPSDANANLRASTVHGAITNDFNIPVRDGEYVGHDLAGTLGRGGVRVKLGNVNGSVSIRHASDGRALSPVSDVLIDKEKIKSKYKNKQRGLDDSDPTDAARDAGREAQREARDALREAAREQEQTRREAEQSRREAEQSRLDATHEQAQAQTQEQRELAQSTAEIQREAARATRAAAREIELHRKDIERAARVQSQDQIRLNGVSEMRLTERESKSFAVNGTPHLTIETFDGTITVTAWDKPEVGVTAIKRTSDEQSMRGIRLQAQQNNLEITLRADFDKSFARRIGNVTLYNASVNYEVNVPRNSKIFAKSSDGRLHVEDVNGELDLRTIDGAVDVRGGQGHLVVNTSDGRVRITNYDGMVDARTGDGSMILEGRFTQLAARTGDGSITLAVPADASASIETDADSVSHDGLNLMEENNESKRLRRWRLGNGGGNTYRLQTGDGHITLRALNGSER